MEKPPFNYLIAVMILLISTLIKDTQFGLIHLLSVCKRLETKVSRCVINEYKRLIEDSNIERQGFMKFGEVAPIGELRI